MNLSILLTTIIEVTSFVYSFQVVNSTDNISVTYINNPIDSELLQNSIETLDFSPSETVSIFGALSKLLLNSTEGTDLEVSAEPITAVYTTTSATMTTSTTATSSTTPSSIESILFHRKQLNYPTINVVKDYTDYTPTVQKTENIFSLVAPENRKTFKGDTIHTDRFVTNPTTNSFEIKATQNITQGANRIKQLVANSSDSYAKYSDDSIVNNPNKTYKRTIVNGTTVINNVFAQNNILSTTEKELILNFKSIPKKHRSEYVKVSTVNQLIGINEPTQSLTGANPSSTVSVEEFNKLQNDFALIKALLNITSGIEEFTQSIEVTESNRNGASYEAFAAIPKLVRTTINPTMLTQSYEELARTKILNETVKAPKISKIGNQTNKGIILNDHMIKPHQTILHLQPHQSMQHPTEISNIPSKLLLIQQPRDYMPYFLEQFSKSKIPTTDLQIETHNIHGNNKIKTFGIPIINQNILTEDSASQFPPINNLTEVHKLPAEPHRFDLDSNIHDSTVYLNQETEVEFTTRTLSPPTTVSQRKTVYQNTENSSINQYLKSTPTSIESLQQLINNHNLELPTTKPATFSFPTYFEVMGNKYNTTSISNYLRHLSNLSDHPLRNKDVTQQENQVNQIRDVITSTNLEFIQSDNLTPRNTLQHSDNLDLLSVISVSTIATISLNTPEMEPARLNIELNESSTSKGDFQAQSNQPNYMTSTDNFTPVIITSHNFPSETPNEQKKFNQIDFHPSSTVTEAIKMFPTQTQPPRLSNVGTYMKENPSTDPISTPKILPNTLERSLTINELLQLANQYKILEQSLPNISSQTPGIQSEQIGNRSKYQQQSTDTFKTIEKNMNTFIQSIPDVTDLAKQFNPFGEHLISSTISPIVSQPHLTNKEYFTSAPKGITIPTINSHIQIGNQIERTKAGEDISLIKNNLKLLSTLIGRPISISDLPHLNELPTRQKVVNATATAQTQSDLGINKIHLVLTPSIFTTKTKTPPERQEEIDDISLIKNDLKLLSSLIGRPIAISDLPKLSEIYNTTRQQPSKMSEPSNYKMNEFQTKSTSIQIRSSTTSTLNKIKAFQESNLLEIETTTEVNKKLPIISTAAKKEIEQLRALLKSQNLRTMNVNTIPGFYGKSDDAILASLLKQQGIGPSLYSIPTKNLQKLLYQKEAMDKKRAVSTQEITHKTQPLTPPRQSRPLIDGLTWLWKTWQETGTSPKIRLPVRNSRYPDTLSISLRTNNYNNVTDIDAKTDTGQNEPGIPLLDAALSATRAVTQFLGAALQLAGRNIQSVWTAAG